jgi:predicted metal-dependent hydrolase
MSEINYKIKRSKRARRVSIGVHHTGEVVVTLPLRAPVERADYFIRMKMPWIVRVKKKMERRFAEKIALKQSRQEYLALKDKALDFIKERLMYYNEHYHFRYNRVSIKMQISRWGSCSRYGNLNFNYGLINLPQELADYVVVHELCHLKEMNHGPKFWAMVAETIPDYRERRKILKKWISIK